MNALGGQFFLFLQLPDLVRPDLRILASERTHGLASARGNAVLVHGGAKARLVHIESLFAGDVAGDFEGQAVGGIKIKCLVPFEDLRVGGFQSGEQILQLSGARLDGPRETDFFARQIVEDGSLIFAQFGIEVAILVNDRLGHFGEERFVKPDLGAEARRAADDHARDVVAPAVAGDDAVCDEEGRAADVVTDDAIGCEIRIHFLFAMTRERTQDFERAGEEVGLVVGVHALQNRDNALEPHARVHVFGGKRLETAIVEEIVLDEDVVPQFEETRALAVHAALMRDIAQVVEFFTAIQMNFRTRAAGARFRHLPEIILAAKEQHMRQIEAGLGAPGIGGLVIARDIALIVFEASGVDLVLRQAPDLGEQLPRPGDGFLFVVIAKGPVAEHLEEGVMRIVAADIVEVVVLARHAHTLLRVHGAGVGTLVRAEEDVLELHHARVGEQQGGVPAGDKGHRGHDGMSVPDEEVNEGLADLVAGQFFGHSDSDGT